MSRTHNQKMADKHEDEVCEAIGARKTRGSGNQWRDQTDGKHNHRETDFAFAFDGKSTTGKGVNVTREMWQKTREQAAGERPLLALRFYEDDTLEESQDLVVMSLDDFVEMREAATKNNPPKPESSRHFTKIELVTINGLRKIIVDGVEKPPGVEVNASVNANNKTVITLEGRRLDAELYIDGQLKASTRGNYLKQREYFNGEPQ